MVEKVYFIIKEDIKIISFGITKAKVPISIISFWVVWSFICTYEYIRYHHFDSFSWLPSDCSTLTVFPKAQIFWILYTIRLGQHSQIGPWTVPLSIFGAIDEIWTILAFLTVACRQPTTLATDVDMNLPRSELLNRIIIQRCEITRKLRSLIGTFLEMNELSSSCC